MSECGVCLSSDCDGYIEFYDSNIVKARKPHRCGECGREIPKGASYERAIGKFDNDFFFFKTCLDCQDIRDGFRCDGGGGVHGELWEQMNDYGFEAMTTGCLAKLDTASAKAYLVERWRKWKGLT